MNKPLLNPKAVTNDVVTRGALPGVTPLHIFENVLFGNASPQPAPSHITEINPVLPHQHPHRRRQVIPGCPIPRSGFS